MGRWAYSFWRWANLLYQKVGADSDTLPVELGGTGESNIAAVVATTSSAGSSTSATALTQTKVVTLERPPNGGLQTADTVVTWDTPFADANYTVTPSVVSSRFASSVAVVGGSITATQVTLRLTSVPDLDESASASGTAQVTGVHT